MTVWLEIKEQQGISRDAYVARVGVPFSRLDNVSPLTHEFQLALPDSSIVAPIIEPTSYWPNGGLKWAVVHFAVPIDANQSSKCELTWREVPSTNFKVSNSETQFKNIDVFKDIELTLFDQDKHHLVFDSGTETRIENGDSYLSKAIFECQIPAKKLAFQWQLQRDSLTDVCHHKVQIHNQARAQHPDGRWDLGDTNACAFKSLLVDFKNRAGEAELIDIQMSDVLASGEEFELIQHSSGGANCFSKVHVNSENIVPFNVSGFQLKAKEEVSGSRVSPLVSISGQQTLAIHYPHFWQNFPSSISKSKDKLTLGLFPDTGYDHSVEPGEKKTQSFYTGPSGSELTSHCLPVSIHVDPNYVARANVLAFFSPGVESELQQIIDLGLDEQKGFVAKAELIDEFGWRNFGDLYADHENSEFKGEKPIISHYNNQYDPVFGFIRQFLKSGDDKWWTLANNLAAHVTDIDIYHTELDRSEYNGGLFWHTDHYVDAATAGHRTYSVNQPQNVYQDHAGGGGPGGQHCYTTGLALHYLMTGDDASKQAVLTLSDWITKVYEGSGGVLDYLLAVKNADYRRDLKNPKTGQYPLDRGTGNYIVALIDSFEVTGQQSYLDRASLVIKNTVGLDEDLALRNLDNVEETWFYTVFLQAVGRYLWTKKSVQQTDESYVYCVKLLQKFAAYMATNEAPYLTRPDILEFPNQTWTAQDLRKVNVLYLAALFTEDNQSFVDKAIEIRNYIVQELSKDADRDYCRILCLLMQNEGMQDFYASQDVFVPKQMSRSVESHTVPPRFFAEVFARLKQTSIKSELDWLAMRSSKIAQILNREH